MRYNYGAYYLLPTLAAVVWTATLLGLLLWWIVDDKHIAYRPSEASVVFISDVGATHKALFVAGTALTLLFYTATLLAERYLRHMRRIPGSLKARHTRIDIAAVVFGILGGLALLFLSIFDAFTHPTAHWILTAAFVISIAISALLQTQEVRGLEATHPDRAHLRRNAIAKVSIVSFALVGAIIFGATLGICRSKAGIAPTPRCNVDRSVAGAFEWFIAFLFALYLATFIVDLWPARKTAGHTFNPALVEADRNNTLHTHKDGRPGAPFRAEDYEKSSPTLQEDGRGFRAGEHEGMTLALQQEGRFAPDQEHGRVSDETLQGSTHPVQNGSPYLGQVEKSRV